MSSFDENFAELERQFAADPSNPELLKQLERAFTRSGQTLNGSSIETLREWLKYDSDDETIMPSEAHRRQLLALQAIADTPWICVLLGHLISGCATQRFPEELSQRALDIMLKLGPRLSSVRYSFQDHLHSHRHIWSYLEKDLDVFMAITPRQEAIEFLLDKRLLDDFHGRGRDCIRWGLETLKRHRTDITPAFERFIEILEMPDDPGISSTATALLGFIKGLTDDQRAALEAFEDDPRPKLRRAIRHCLDNTPSVSAEQISAESADATTAKQRFQEAFRELQNSPRLSEFNANYKALLSVSSDTTRELIEGWHAQFYPSLKKSFLMSKMSAFGQLSFQLFQHSDELD